LNATTTPRFACQLLVVEGITGIGALRCGGTEGVVTNELAALKATAFIAQTIHRENEKNQTQENVLCFKGDWIGKLKKRIGRGALIAVTGVQFALLFFLLFLLALVCSTKNKA
jgi:hypothetical protein